jgi:hypothetical protein
MDNVQKTAVTDYNAPSSEPFRLHLQEFYFATEQYYLLYEGLLWFVETCNSQGLRKAFIEFLKLFLTVIHQSAYLNVQ